MAWEIRTLTYADKTFYGGVGEFWGQNLQLKPDGTKLYVFSAYNVIKQYALSTPYDIDTAVYEKSGTASSQATHNGFFFKPDGTRVYVINSANRRIYQYTLSTPWNISTMGGGAYGVMRDEDENLINQVVSMSIKPDGLKVYVVSRASDKVYQFSLSSAWNITTIGLAEASYYVGGVDSAPLTIFFKPDGSKMFYLGGNHQSIFQYSLSSAWSIATLSLDEDVYGDISDESEWSDDFFIDPSGTRAYVIFNIWGESFRIWQYALVPDAPTNVVATDGAHTDKVVITWTKSEGATQYRVYRGNTIAYPGTLGDVDTFDDVNADYATITNGSVIASDGNSTAHVALSNPGASANNGATHNYRIRARNIAGYGAEVWSEYSEIDTGYRGVGALTYQWYKSAGDSDANYSIISGATESTYNDVEAPEPTITPGSAAASDGVSTTHVALSLSGQSTVNGDGRYYKCYHTAEGTAGPEYTEANRGYRGVGTLTYQWQRSPDDIDVGHSNISGAVTAAYNDTDAPADGSGRYYRCVENATGAAQQISTTDRGYRMYAPTVVTQAASSITDVSATLNGNITDAGGPITTRGFKYYKDGEPGNVLDVHEDGTFEEGVYGLGISSLVNGTKYYFRAYATNDAGISYGSWLDFTTEVYLPLVTTESPSDIGIDHAKGNGTIVSGANVTERGFEVVLAFSGSLQEYTDHKMAGFAGTATYNSITKKWEGTLTKTITETGTFGAGAFTGNIGAFPTALPSDKIFGGEVYIYKARATNDVGIGYGSWVLLTALSYPAGGGPDDQIPIDDVVGIFYYRKAYPKRDMDELREKCRLFQDNIVEYALVINHNSRVLQRFLNDLTLYAGADEYNTFRPIIPPQHLNALARRPLSVGDFKVIINSFINNSVDNANNVNNNFRLIRGGLSDYTYTEDEGFVDISIRTKIVIDDKPDVEGLTKVIDKLNKEMADNYLVINHNSHVLRSILI